MITCFIEHILVIFLKYNKNSEFKKKTLTIFTQTPLYKGIQSLMFFKCQKLENLCHITLPSRNSSVFLNYNLEDPVSSGLLMVSK